MNSIVSWNVNGIRAAEKKGLFDFLQSKQPDVLCVQETKATVDELSSVFTAPPGYTAYWSNAEKKGYSGVLVYSKLAPKDIHKMNIGQFDAEGRYIQLSFDTFELINAYFPNSQAEGKRLPYKLEFCSAMLEKCNNIIAAGRDVVLCGDFNIAHKPIDLANPEANKKNPGYLPEERAWLDEFVAAGYVDTFRQFCAEPKQYTWWSYRSNAREKNVGWRIDYHFVHQNSLSRVEDVEILPDVYGSDHCPILMTFKD